ncbi:hypothetical protein NMD06_22760 [Citrobacter braakii]
MSLYVLYFFAISVLFAFLHLLTKNKKTKKISSVLGRQGNIIAKNEELVSNIEKIYRKTSKTVTFFDFLDSNIFLKFGMIIAFALLIFTLGALGILKYDKQTQAIIIGVALVFVILTPPRIKNYIMRKKTKKINVDLPYVIDIMSICVQSGMTIENALIYISKNIQFINSDIASLLERTAIKIEVSGIVSALDQLYEEVQAPRCECFVPRCNKVSLMGHQLVQCLLSYLRRCARCSFYPSKKRLLVYPLKWRLR